MTCSKADSVSDELVRAVDPDYDVEYSGIIMCHGDDGHTLDPAIHFTAPVFGWEEGYQ